MTRCLVELGTAKIFAERLGDECGKRVVAEREKSGLECATAYRRVISIYCPDLDCVIF